MAKRIYHNQMVAKFSNMEVQIQDLSNKVAVISSVVSDIQKKLGESTVASIQATSNGAPFQPQAPIYQLAENVSVIGLREILIARHSAVKLAWIFLLVLGIGGTGYFIYDTVDNYMDEPTVTKVSCTIKYQPKRMFEYPPIVFCHDAWFDIEKAMTMGLSIDSLKYALQYMYHDIVVTLINASEAKENFYRIYRQHKFTSLIHFYQHVMVDLEQKPNQTAFMNSTLPSFFSKNKGVKMEKMYLPNQPSMCYRFTLPDYDSQMNIINEPDTVFLKSEYQAQNLIPTEPGWRIYFVSEDHASLSLPLYLPPSMNYKVTINSKIVRSLDTNDAPCAETTNANCLSTCLNLPFTGHTNCTMFDLVNDASLAPWDYCNLLAQSPENSSLVNFLAQDNSAFSQMGITCSNRCPKNCERTDYEAMMQGFVPLEKEGNSNLSTIGVTFVHDGARDGEIMIIQEVNSCTFTGLMNNVGGTLGLFIGSTLYTFVQLFFVLVNYVFAKRA